MNPKRFMILTVIFAATIIITSLLLENADAQRFIPPGTGAYLFWIENKESILEFPVDYKMTDSNDILILDGTFEVTTEARGYGQGKVGYLDVIHANFQGPYTMEITPQDPNNTWTVIGAMCSYDLSEESFTNQPNSLALEVPALDLRNWCQWILDNKIDDDDDDDDDEEEDDDDDDDDD